MRNYNGVAKYPIVKIKKGVRMETKFSKSWKEFKEGEDGQSALSLETLKNLTDVKYLENRLHTAFSAGYNANIPLDGRVMPKIAEIIENKKQKIDESLRDYLSTALDMTKEREGQLKLIASCERAILTEVLVNIKSNFTA